MCVSVCVEGGGDLCVRRGSLKCRTGGIYWCVCVCGGGGCVCVYVCVCVRVEEGDV